MTRASERRRVGNGRQPGVRRRGAASAGLAALALVAGSGAARAESVLTGDLPRQAALGFAVEQDAGKLRLGRLDPDSPAARAGLRDGDVVVEVGGRRFVKDYVGADLLRRLDGGVEVELTVERAGQPLSTRFTPQPLALEAVSGVDTVYGVVEMPDGARLRTLVTRPRGASGPLPAIFFTQWVSCDSVEFTHSDIGLEVMRGVAERSGMAMIRVERSSGGDSEGPGCHELDYDTEVAHYRTAFRALVRPPLVDPRRTVVWGNSLGSTTAPLVAAGQSVAGMIVGGGGAQTYFERMLQFDRIGFERSDTDPGEVDRWMRQHAEFHVEYLLHGKSPEQVAAQRPDLAGVWGRMRGTGDGVHYGRPYAYHQQAAAKDFLAAWAGVAAPALVLYQEYDQFEYAEGHRVIAETLNRLRPGSASYLELPRMGHDFRVYPSREAAAAWRGGHPAPELAIQPILRWLLERGLGSASR
jgi:hypothetical protein